MNTRPLKRVEPGIYETTDEKYGAFKSTSQWTVGGNGRSAVEYDLAACQKRVARWIELDTEAACQPRPLIEVLADHEYGTARAGRMSRLAGQVQ